MGMHSPSVGEPGYLPYCGACSTMRRMHRDEEKKAFVCGACGLETRRINGEDMFDRTAPSPTGRIRRSEPNMQTLRPPMTDDQRKMVEDIKAALRK